MTNIKEAHELKEGCGKHHLQDEDYWCGDRRLNSRFKYCQECKAKAKANLEALGCGKKYNATIREIGLVRHGIATCDGIGEIALCPTCQQAKEIYEGILG